MSRRKTATIVAGCLLFLAACSSGKGGAPFTVSASPVRTNSVELPKSLKFVPQAIEISVGTTVTWTNHDEFPHNVALLDGGGVVKPLAIGASASITFTKPGTTLYHCSIHPQMHGAVIVTP